MTHEITFRTTYRAEKPYGIGNTAHERHTRIVGGWVAEAVDGLRKGEAVYTGACETEEQAITELGAELYHRGYEDSRLVRIR